MLQFYVGFLLILYCTLSISTDPDKTSLKSMSNHLSTPADQNNVNELVGRKFEKQLLNEHLKVIIIIGGISVGIMAIIVCIYISIKYLRIKTRNTSQTIEQTEPLNKTKENKFKTTKK